MEMMSKGAEADIYLHDGRIFKERIPKSYRVKELDENLRKTRTKKEAKLISLARRAGVPTPFIYDVDLEKMRIEMGHVEGGKIKSLIDKMDEEQRGEVFEEIGRCIGRLHSKHIIHGDITTSNMILSGGRVFFIDFGLGEVNESVEAKGVDLLVLKKALHSTHYRFENECFDRVLKGYREEFNGWEEVLNRLRVIEKRGRYFAER